MQNYIKESKPPNIFCGTKNFLYFCIPNLRLYMFSHLTYEELLMFILHTIFDTSGNSTTRIKEVMTKLLGSSFNDTKRCVVALRGRNLLESRNYNWRNDTYEYSVPQEILIEAMRFIYEKHPNEVIKVMDAADKAMKPTKLQRILWEYISSDFTKLDFDNIGELDKPENRHILYGVMDKNEFAPIILQLNEQMFYNLMEEYILQAMEKGAEVNTKTLRTFIDRYDFRKTPSGHLELKCKCDLLDYMMSGMKPEQLHASNASHRIIAAIHESYHGRYDVAMEHFKKAISINNKQRPYFTGNRPFLPYNIANFLMVIACFLSGKDEDRRKASVITKNNNAKETEAARVLYGILSGTSADKQMSSSLAALTSNTPDVKMFLAALMAQYIGKPLATNVASSWLLLKQEMRKYEILDEATREKADEAFGKEGLLTRIYHKQEWESVLEDLMVLGNGASGIVNKKEVRIGYFMGNMRAEYVQPRLQSILKNGKWSSGKNISIQSFRAGMVEGMTHEDKAIANTSIDDSFYSYDVTLNSILPYMTKESRLYVGNYAPYSLVEVTEEMPYITLRHDASGFLITSNVPSSDINNKVIITHRGAASINFIQLTEEQRPYYKRLLSLGHFPNEAEEQLKTFLKGIGGKIEVNSDLIEGGSTLPLTEGNAQLVMQMRPLDKENYSVVLFVRPLENGRIRCMPGDGNEIIIDGENNSRTRVKRDLAKEKENMEHLLDAIEYPVMTSEEVPYYELLPILEYAQQNPDRISCEWPEGAQMKIKQRQTASGWTGAIKKNDNGWFEIEGNVQLDEDRVISMAQLFDLIGQSHGRFIKLNDGEFLALSDRLRKQLEQLNAIASRSKGKLQMSPFAAALIGADTFDGELFLKEDDELTKIRQRIKDASTYSPHVPKTLNAKLRDYQKEGFQWIARLNKWGAGALLADDMGLGKTVQTISFLLTKAKEGPSLVVAPASVAPNWKNELEKFAPSLRVTMLNFVGDRRDAIVHARDNEVVVTTYGLLLSVKEDITKRHWCTICLDEAHIIKNRGAKTSAVAMQLHSDYRIMLTGTPVQNHLGELWNLFQFVNPGLLGSFEDFNRRFIIPIEQNKDEDRQADLDRLVKPFMLRRTKDKVAKELPEKEEIYQHVDLSEEEMLIYEAMRQRAETLLLAEQGNSVSMNTLAEITKLRQCACDVRLIDNKMPDVGSKIIALTELLQTITESDGHALVFSQFTSYLALIQKALKEAGIPYLYIDGSVDIKTRTKLVNEFQNGDAPVFLISLKAGGLGLNLTRANYVVHMDPWWNPAIEAQATDRAHRIGQKQSVTVYHMIASGTIEEKIQRLHTTKKALADSILNATDASHKLTGEELLEMIRK